VTRDASGTQRSDRTQTTEEVRQANANLTGVFVVLSAWNSGALDAQVAEQEDKTDVNA
jgi:hypothetical protein